MHRLTKVSICFQCSFYCCTGLGIYLGCTFLDQSQNYLADKSYLTHFNLFTVAYLFPDRHSNTVFSRQITKVITVCQLHRE